MGFMKPEPVPGSSWKSQHHLVPGALQVLGLSFPQRAPLWSASCVWPLSWGLLSGLPRNLPRQRSRAKLSAAPRAFTVENVGFLGTPPGNASCRPRLEMTA